MNAEGQDTLAEQKASPAEAVADSKVAELEQKIARLEAEKQDLQNQMLRAIADAQNLLRRTREQHEEAVRFAPKPLVESLLPVLDSFERGLSSLDAGASVDKVMEGFRATERLLRQALAMNKIERIASVGEKFDPERHEAISTLVCEDRVEGTIVQEIEPGYTMHGRVVRPARVQVAVKQ